MDTHTAASAAITLGLLISELSQEPWKGRSITFNETHQLHKVLGTSLKLKEKLRPLVESMAQRQHMKGANLQVRVQQDPAAGGGRRAAHGHDGEEPNRVFVLSA